MEKARRVVEERVITAPPALELNYIGIEVERLRATDPWTIQVCMVAHLSPAGDKDPMTFYSVYSQAETMRRNSISWTDWEGFVDRHFPVLKDKLDELGCGYPVALDHDLSGSTMISTTIWEAPQV